jgi:flagellar basal-body rod protein FlgC
MFASIDISMSGLKAYGKQLEVIGSNIANVKTTDAGNGEPYRKLEAIFKTAGEDGDSPSGVEIDEILKDDSPFKMDYNPQHPNANEQGYVMMPNVNYAMELINLNSASRAYQTNASMLKRYSKMVNTTLELLK